MSNFKIYSLLLIAALMLSLNSFASHFFSGSEINVQESKSSKDTIYVSFHVYRDCNGASIKSESLEMKGCSSSASNTINLNYVFTKEVTPVCKNTCTKCIKGSPNSYPGNTSCSFAYGIEEFTAVAKYGIPKSYRICNNFTFSYSTCCRNSNITTGPADAGYHISTKYNRFKNMESNTPTIINPPVSIVCSEVCKTIDFSAFVDNKNSYNIKKDSLVYFLTKPLESATGAVSYSSGYSFLKPITFEENKSKKPPYTWNLSLGICEGFTLDSQTGILRFKAKKSPQISVFAITVQCWGRDTLGKKVLKSSVSRDMQITIVKCPKNMEPVLSGLNGTKMDTMNLCPNEKFCFNLTSYDADSNDTVTQIFPKHLPVGFTVKNLDSTTIVKHPRTQLCVDANQLPFSNTYSFITLGLQDNACPLNQKITKTFYFRKMVIKNDSSAGRDKSICLGDSVQIGKTSKSKHFYKWTSSFSGYKDSIANPFIKPSISGKLALKDSVIGQRCPLYDTINVTVHQPIGVSFSQKMDKLGTVILSANLKLKDYPQQFLWKFSDTSATFTSDTVIRKLNSSGSFFATIFSRDSIGCLDSFSSNIVVTKVEDFETLDNISIYPNPTSTILNIAGNNNLIYSIRLIDFQGRIILELQNQSLPKQLDINSFPTGIYYMILIDRKSGKTIHRYFSKN